MLQDRKDGWPGLCLKLFDASQIENEDICKQVCHYDARCAVWQFNNQTSPGQCWVGFGENCVYRDGYAASITVQGAQRLMHGEVKVLMNISGWKINNLYNIGMFHEGNMDVSILRCKAWCYSSIHCEYWQYGPGGCWVDGPLFSTARGTNPGNKVQYPLTTNGGATNTTVEASGMMFGEYIQHYCPPEDGESEDVAATASEAKQAAVVLGAAKGELEDPGGLPWWQWIAAIALVALCIAMCVYQMAGGAGGKRSKSKNADRTRGMKIESQEQEGFQDSMMDSMDRSQGPNEYNNGMDAMPPPPGYGMPPPPGGYPTVGMPGGYGARDIGTSVRSHQSQQPWMQGMPTQRLDAPMLPPIPQYDPGTRAVQPAGVPFPTPAPLYPNSHYPHAAMQQPARRGWY